MDTVTDAISQDAVAESLLGPTDQSETVETQQQPEVDTGEQVSQEDDNDWLPSEQEKVFPAEVISRYAQRYGFTQEQLDANPSLLNVLHDKINSDIMIQQMRNQPEPKPEPEPQRPTQTPVNVQQWLDGAKAYVKQSGLVHPEVSKEFAKGFMQAFGVNELPPGMSPEGLTETFTIFGMNLINSLLPLYFQGQSPAEGKNTLQYMMEQQYEGLGDMAQVSAYRSAWNSIASNIPELAGLKYGSDEFAEAMTRAEEAIPGLHEMQFAGKDGRPLSAKANAERQYQIAARVAQGQRPNPEMMRQAVETGKKQAQQSSIRRGSANLGAGKSNQGFSKQTDDDFWSKPESWNDYLDKRL